MAMFTIASLMDLVDTLLALIILTPLLKSFASPLGIPEFFRLFFKRFCKNNKIDFISIDTAEGYLHPLEQFFNSRIHRY